MPTLTLKDVPDELYRRLAERAEQHRRSLEAEALDCLGSVVDAETERILGDIESFRRAMGPIHVTEADLQRAKQEGRP